MLFKDLEAGKAFAYGGRRCIKASGKLDGGHNCTIDGEPAWLPSHDNVEPFIEEIAQDGEVINESPGGASSAETADVRRPEAGGVVQSVRGDVAEVGGPDAADVGSAVVRSAGESGVLPASVSGAD